MTELVYVYKKEGDWWKLYKVVPFSKLSGEYPGGTYRIMTRGLTREERYDNDLSKGVVRQPKRPS